MNIKKVKPFPGMVITENVIFESGEYDFFGKEGIIIGADNITVYGNSARLLGGYEKAGDASKGNAEEFGYGYSKSDDNVKNLGFYGTGIFAGDKHGVTIKSLKLSGFDIGLHAKNGEGFIIEDCDFSGCFTDPKWGWDDHGFHGGILFEHMHKCRIMNCKAQYVWDALNMRYSNDNRVKGNDFSHTSDTGLKLWNSCRNEICDNDFSYGIRIDPGEVHARDSSGVLIESGSNDNILKRNNITHGGDGLFIRVLNGWMSTGNYFEENDCSFANNNAIEAWADGNTYVRNKANYSSYGFWLGGSDNTVLDGNEAAFNGVRFKNAPESFGNAGIAVVNGSGSHIVMENNYIHDNNGPGVAIRFNKDYPSFHWVIQGNRIVNNKNDGKYKGHGIYAKNARWLTFGRNIIENNEGEPVFFDENTADIVILQDSSKSGKVKAAFEMVSEVIYAGEEVTFNASASGQDSETRSYRWDLGDGTLETGSCIAHTYKKAGFYRMGLTVDNGAYAGLAFRNIYVLPSHDITGIGDEINEWAISGDAGSYEVSRDNKCTVSGTGSVCFKAGKGTCHKIEYPVHHKLGLCIKNKNTFNIYFRYVTDSEPDWDRKQKKPVITFIADSRNYIEFTPDAGITERLFVSQNEEKDNWQLISINIDGQEGWKKRIAGKGLENGVINCIRFDYGNANPGISRLWLDAMCFTENVEETFNSIDLALNRYNSSYPAPLFSSCAEHSDVRAPVMGETRFFGDGTPRFATASGKDGFYGVEFGCRRELNRVDVCFYNNLTKTSNARNEAVPIEACIEMKNCNGWQEIPYTRTKPYAGQNIFLFRPVIAEGIRVRFICNPGYLTAINRFSAYNTQNVIAYGRKGLNARISSNRKHTVAVDAFEVKLNKEINGNGTPLGDLTARVFELDDRGKLTKCLFGKVISKDDIIPYAITKIKAGISGLESGRKYALVLGQTNTAESRTVGDYYRWIAGKTGFTETFAIFDRGETKPSDYDWGTAYLRVTCGGLTADYSNESEHVGTRFGIKDMECRYMTFTVPEPEMAMADGIASGEAGWMARESDEEGSAKRSCAKNADIEKQDAEVRVVFDDEKCINGANVWIDGDKPMIVRLMHKGKVLSSVSEPDTGLVTFSFDSVKGKEFILRICCKQGICIVREIELKNRSI